MTVDFSPKKLDVRGVPVGTSVVFNITPTDATPGEDDVFEAVVYKGNATLVDADIVIASGVVTCTWTNEQITSLGVGTYKWRFTRTRAGLSRDLCAGKFEVRPRV